MIVREASPRQSAPTPALQQVLLAGFALVILVCGFVLLCMPMPILLDHYMPDDAFYYLNIARHFAHSGFSSFDGLHYTNGYHPLWMLCCAPVFRLFPQGGEWAVRVILLLQLCLAVTATLLFISALVRHFGIVAAAIGGAIWVVILQRLMLNGLETALLAALYAGLFNSFGRWVAAPPSARSAQQLVLLGALTGLVFLARTDHLFLAVLLCLVVVRQCRVETGKWSNALRQALLCVLPALGLILGYLATNMLATGHLMPISGCLKFGGVAAVLAHPHGRPAEIWHAGIQALLAPMRQAKFLSVSLSVLLPWLLCAVARIPRWQPRLAPVLRYRVFYAGATCAYLYYLLCNYVTYSMTGWYYLPQTLLAVFSIAALVSLAVTRPARPTPVNAWLIGLLLPALLGYSLLSIMHETRRVAPQWNARLYATARWMRGHLPAQARVCAFDAGILGYFSHCTVINVDGLVNDYDFYERYRRWGKADEYCRQWDYVVNAFPDGDDLSRRFPGAQEIPLPASLTSPFHAPYKKGMTLRVHLLRFSTAGDVR